MAEEGSLRTSLVKPRQFLGPPRVLAPRKAGHVSATVQFIVPALVVASEDRPRLMNIFEHVGIDIHAAAVERVANEATNQVGTLVSATFHLPEGASEEATDAAVDNVSALLVERFLGMLSFLTGSKRVAVNAQTTRSHEGASFSTTLEPTSRSAGDRIALQLPAAPFETRTPPPNVLNALLWLRRGLAASDSFDTYGALMVTLETMAREIVGANAAQRSCPECGSPSPESTVTEMVRTLVVDRLGAPADLFATLWSTRNEVVARGNGSLTAETFRRLTELKFDATNLCYKAIKLALAIPVDGPPQLDPALFVASALMDVH
jgi:hypothetical protein